RVPAPGPAQAGRLEVEAPAEALACRTAARRPPHRAQARLRRPHRGMAARRAPAHAAGRALGEPPDAPRLLRSPDGRPPARRALRSPSQPCGDSVGAALLLDVAPPVRGGPRGAAVCGRRRTGGLRSGVAPGRRMPIFAGLCCRHAGARVGDSTCDALRRALSRDTRDARSAVRVARVFLAKVDIGAYGEPAFMVRPGGSVSLLAGEPLLATGDPHVARGRGADLA